MVRQNVGDSSSQYRGDKPTNDSDYMLRYLQDNFQVKVGQINEIYAGGYVAEVTFGSASKPAIWLSHVLGGLSNSCDFTMPSLGSRVLVFGTDAGPNIILGCLPSPLVGAGHIFPVSPTSVNYHTLKQHNVLTRDNDVELNYYSDGRPNDALPGDIGWMNEIGNTISILKGLLLLKANETSQVQIHHLDSLIRVISKSYEQISEGKSFSQYNDHGNLSSEEEIFHTQAESSGAAIGDAISEEDKEFGLKLQDNLESPYVKQLKHNGFLGYGLHLYNRDSNRGEEQNIDESQHGTEVHIDTAGSTTIRSTKEIKLVKTVSTIWPKKLNEYFEREEKAYEEIKPFEYTKEEAGAKILQEAEKEAWDKKEYSKRNYHKDDWEKAEIISPETKDDDKGSSLIFQREDGSIVFEDASGSSIELDGKKNIRLSCAGNITLQSGEDTIVLAGKNIVHKAKSHLEQTASEGSVKIRANTDMQLLSKTKGITIETEGNGSTDKGAISGIKLKAHKSAPVVIESANAIQLWAKALTCSVSSAVRIESKNILLTDSENENSRLIISKNNIITESKNTITQVEESIFMKSKTLYSTGSQFVISGSSQGYIHGGGSVGVHINHVHSFGIDEFKWARDCLLGGKKLYWIKKSNTHKDKMLSNIDFTSIEDIIAPFDKDFVDTMSFKYSAYDGTIYNNSIFQQQWQEEHGILWNIEKDEQNNTHSFPGKDYEKYMTYTPAFDAEKEEPKGSAGKFEGVPISKYLI